MPVKELPIMHIKASYNNTIITLSDCNGRVLTWTSAVCVSLNVVIIRIPMY